MKDSNILYCFRLIMKNINFILILLVSIIVVSTTTRISRTLGARNFLDLLESIPREPWHMPLFALSGYLLLLLVMLAHREMKNTNTTFVCFALLEGCISYLIVWALNFDVNAIWLVVIADLMKYWSNTKTKIASIGVLFLVYVLTEFDVVFGGNRSVASMQMYLTYYSSSVRMYLSALKSILVSVNTLIFLFYMVLLIRLQVLENERVQQLNQQLDQAVSQLKDANEQLKYQASMVEKMAETKERNRLAREIHDTLGHSLTSIIAGIDACITLEELAPGQAKKQLQLIGDVARRGMKDVRRSVSALRPDALDHMNIEEALQQVINDMKLTSNAQIHFKSNAGILELDEDEEEVIYRIVQESITNSIRHGKATEVWVELEREFSILNVSVRDNGIGCENVTKGFGLRHMSERIKMINGILEYDGSDGFRITAKIPLRWGK